MILIVDSGSTKAEWAFLDKKKTTIAETTGINPATQMGQEFHFDTGFPIHLLSFIKETYFYGAGVKSDESKAIIEHLLKKTGISGHLNIESDLLGAARAACQKKPGVVAILGTGSNVCTFDGKKINQFSPALGYILGDEGSGCHLGKEILRAFFNRTMPPEISKKFEKSFKINLESLLQNTYKTKGSNAYIASFAAFLTKIDHPWKHKLLQKVFNEFVEQKILPIPEISEQTVHFVGSVSFYHLEALKKVLDSHQITLGTVIQKPMEKLILYHNR